MRFIQVGVGGFGRSWLDRMCGRDDAALVAVVDVAREALERAAQRANLPEDRCFRDLRKALTGVEADAVLCVTPPAAHADVALAALDSGLHVLTEKPLADTMANARRMVEAAEAAGRTLMVSQNYRFSRWVRTMRHLISSGRFGGLDSVLVRFARAPRFEGSFRLKMEHPLVHDMSIHHFDLMRAVTGLEPVSVYAETWRPAWSWFEHDPCATALFTFENEVRIAYHGSWVTRGPETEWSGYWCAECAGAAFELRGNEVHIVSADHQGQDTMVELHDMPCEGQDFALVEFMQAVAQGRAPETSGRDNLTSLAMVFAVTESAARGEPVAIKDVLGAV